MWKFLVKNQSIEIVEREILADHQIQYVQFKFTFDGDWKRFHKVVQFSQCDEVYSVVLGTEGTTLYLPAELHAGAVKMAVFGYDTESDTTVRATTVPVTLNIRESGFEGDEPPIPPTPDLYTQLLKRIEDAEHGLDGKSAYEIAVEHGYVGTEEEWLASLHGKDGITPDMSEYPKTSEVQTIVEQQIAPVAEESHTHDNKETLDAITPELFADLSGLQQFEDKTQYEIQTLNEAVENLRPSTHTHNNKAVLDRITEAMIDAIAEYPPFEDWTREQIHTLFEMVNNFSNTAHTHENKVTLDALTPELFSDLAGLQQFEDSTQYDIQTINEALLTLNAQRHTHDNKAVLDTITEQYMRDQAAFQASVPEITRILYEKGYTRPDGKDKVWDHSRIHYMIANEKYAGDIIAQKYYVKDYITHRSRLNNGALPSVYIKNHHEPIISRKQFERCNVILELKKRTAPLQYPYAEFFRCPYCGHVLRQRKLLIQNCYAHFCCEGKGACREFAIPSQEVEKAILKAYESLDLKEVKRIINSKNTDRAENAEVLLQVKEKYPAFSKLDYWWLDDLIERIDFGLHSHTASELKKGGIDDRTISIHWKCGSVTTLSSGVLRDSQDPRHKAELWDAYLLRYPSQFPKLVEEVRNNK